MKTFTAASTLLGLAALAVAEPNPRTPPQTNIGSPLSITYDVDPTGTWNSCTVSLMSGSNFDMVKVVDIDANHDCTRQPGQISWPVPQVSPASLIYFIQFTNNANASETPVWTTRFAIADNGQTTPPANPTQENGDAIAWGVGSLGANGGGGDGVVSSSSTSSDPFAPSSSSAPIFGSSSAPSSNPFSAPSSSAPASSTTSTPAPSSRPASSSRAVNLASTSSKVPTGAATSVKTGSAAAGMGVALVAALVAFA